MSSLRSIASKDSLFICCRGDLLGGILLLLRESMVSPVCLQSLPSNSGGLKHVPHPRIGKRQPIVVPGIGSLSAQYSLKTRDSFPVTPSANQFEQMSLPFNATGACWRSWRGRRLASVRRSPSIRQCFINRCPISHGWVEINCLPVLRPSLHVFPAKHVSVAFQLCDDCQLRTVIAANKTFSQI